MKTQSFIVSAICHYFMGWQISSFEWNPFESEEQCAGVRDRLAKIHKEGLWIYPYEIDGQWSWSCEIEEEYTDTILYKHNSLLGLNSESYREAICMCAYETIKHLAEANDE